MMAADISKAELEIGQLKDAFGPDLHVICNVGEFSHIVTISFKEWFVKLKFQITGDYPHTPAELIISGSAGAVDMMTSHLEQFLKTETETTSRLLDLALAAKRWLEENGVHPTVAVPLYDKKPKSKKGPRKNVTNDQTSSDVPKKKMRTASDVIKRIRWQNEFKTEDFAVGYLDRFLGVQEKEFGAFSWDDISTVDDFAVLAIPKHRIRYFKYQGTIIWDKTSRLDNVFGSTGSGITLGSYLADPTAADVQDQGGQQAETVCEDDSASSDEQSDDDEDDDGVVVHVGSSNNTASAPSAATLPSPVVTPSPHLGRLSKRQRPNYFVCQRITNPEIVNGVKEVQSKIRKVAPAFSSSFVDPESLHITFCTIRLDNEHEVAAACGFLQQAANSLSTMARQGVCIRVSRVSHFYNRVLIAAVDRSPPLVEFAASVRASLDQFVADAYEFKPHVTILKLTRENERAVGSDRVPRRLYSEFGNKEFGVQLLSALDLCAMSHHIGRPEGEFYVTPLHMDLL